MQKNMSVVLANCIIRPPAAHDRTFQAMSESVPVAYSFQLFW